MEYHSNCPKLPWMIDFHRNEQKEVLNNQYGAAFAETTLEYLSSLNIKSQPSIFRSTQVLCTISSYTSCNSIDDLLSEGMRVAKIVNTNIEKIKEVLSKIRVLNSNYSKKIGRLNPLAIALEVHGPEIRTGQLKPPNKKLYLEKGRLTKLTTEPAYEDFVNADMIYVDYEKLPEVVQPGDKILLDRGSVTLTALECVESIVNCIVEKAGMLISHSSVIVPNAPIELPQISASDKELIELAKGECVDFLCVSGIQDKEGILTVKDVLGPGAESIQIISNIETVTAIESIEGIMEVADGICIDCERLMLELPKEKLFLVQKSILAKCNIAGKPVISTVNINDPKSVTKSEFSDIANVIIDGTDALLLSRDSSTKDVMSAIKFICKEAEPAVYQKQKSIELAQSIPSPMEAIYTLGISAVGCASATNAAAIVCLTSSGRTAKVLARFRPRCPVIVITRYQRVARLLSIYKGVEALLYLRPFIGSWEEDVEKRVQYGIAYGKYSGYIRMGDAVITVTSSRPECGLSNTMKVVYASEFDALPLDKRKIHKVCVQGKINKNIDEGYIILVYVSNELKKPTTLTLGHACCPKVELVDLYLSTSSICDSAFGELSNIHSSQHHIAIQWPIAGTILW
ncbi:unnamed protein product [Phaedon cochleariae]|uniref:Pyruvate kinase n=1 Tax=Phaedon cochleariae TaxID=80249 RepID=A0A9N9SBC8_PHACE|nr:unnamed protein product [Phaedon cochleariae]